jgi:hypothetical protein
MVELYCCITSQPFTTTGWMFPTEGHDSFPCFNFSPYQRVILVLCVHKLTLCPPFLPTCLLWLPIIQHHVSRHFSCSERAVFNAYLVSCDLQLNVLAFRGGSAKLKHFWHYTQSLNWNKYYVAYFVVPKACCTIRLHLQSRNVWSCFECGEHLRTVSHVSV